MLPKKHLLNAVFALSLTCAIGTLPVGAAVNSAPWEKYSSQGAKAYEQASYGQAEKLFRLALKEAEKFGDRDIRLATSLTNLGVLYNFRGQPAKAGPLFERAVAVKQNALGPENFDVISSVSKLCQFYAQQGNLGRAEPICNKIVSYSQKVVRDRQQVSSSFKALATFYQGHKELEDAEVLLKQAQNLTEKATSNQDLELAVLLDGLGTTFAPRPQAESLYKAALEIREQSLTANHIALASSNENLAKLYVAQGKFAQAEPLFRRAFEISQKTLGEKPEVLIRLEALAQCCMKEGRYQEAESLYRQALSTWEKSGRGNPTYVNCEIALGSILSRQGRYAEAAPLLGQALKASEGINGPQHASLSPILDQYADILDKTNRKGEANKCRARARAIRG